MLALQMWHTFWAVLLHQPIPQLYAPGLCGGNHDTRLVSRPKAGHKPNVNARILVKTVPHTSLRPDPADIKNDKSTNANALKSVSSSKVCLGVRPRPETRPGNELRRAFVLREKKDPS
jgi:hypothetical protein